MSTWQPDRELPGHECMRLPLPGAPTYAGEPDEIWATLVRRNAPRSTRALLYIHGWSDYYFQAHLADEAARMGFDFYAVDLRRYGRSLREGQLAGFITDIGHYFEELDAASEVIRADGHDELVLMGHSTGGLISVLWADARPGLLDAVVLNSPWLAMQGGASVVNKVLASPPGLPVFRGALAAVSTVSPTAVVPVESDGIYERSIHSEADGEWDYRPDWKGDTAFRVRAGWMLAVLRGHQRVADGLGIEAPVQVLISDRTSFPRKWSDDVLSADIVLDVVKLADAVPMLGRNTTLVRLEGGMHDLVLSAEPVREAFFDEVERWLAYALPGNTAH